VLITRIEKVQGEYKNYLIYIDDEPSFKAHESNLFKLGLYEERELDKPELDEIKFQVEFSRAKYIAIRYAASKMRTVYEIQKKLRESFDNEIIQNVIEYLAQNQYVDDKLYAQKYILEKSRLNSLSSKGLQFRLKEKGIPEEIISNELKNQEYSEIEHARKLTQKRRDTDIKKLKAYLYRKGFSIETINKVINEPNEND
jgi:regulatory protein